LNRASFDLLYLSLFTAGADCAFEQRGEVLAIHAGGSDGSKFWMLKLQGKLRSAHSSRHWLADAVVNLSEEVEGGFVSREFDYLWLIIEPAKRSVYSIQHLSLHILFF
jgi:hypothetical protein